MRAAVFRGYNIYVSAKDRKKKWIKPRHSFLRKIGFPPISFVVHRLYDVQADRFEEQGDRAYLILMNHQTAVDQFLVPMSFKGPVYYMATEDIFSNGLVSTLLRWSVAPIPIKKQVTDVTAVKTCIRVAREGGTIAIAPEGNRTYSGRTGYMNPAIGGLAKKLGLPIAIYRIEGGYGAHPRWSDEIRKGKIHSRVSRVIEPEEYKDLSGDELFEIIKKELTVDEGRVSGEYLSDHRAEYLERAMYVCPYCGLAEFESSGNVIECKSCGRKIEYGTDKSLKGVGFDFPFRFVTEWYDYQESFVRALDLDAYLEKPIFTDTADMYRVRLYKKKLRLREEAKLSLYGDRVVVDEGSENELVLGFGEADALAVLGRNKFNVYIDGNVYQFKGGKRFNGLKYVNLFHRFGIMTGRFPEDSYLGV